ncbi:hypothetical protein GN109_05775 [Collimonas pratensis]|uniref:hypothetical protein n=1 Tax=Collimonas pratensis TaxID=279113 RepID=UPI00143D7483|nr:hypothetical protein [Collimonas pratensis]NKI68923.1 hypothetical protein [Collimonas pratensis]
MSCDNGGPAFPCLEATMTGISSDGEERYDTEAHGGMSLRDYFAAKAMAALIAHYGHETFGSDQRDVEGCSFEIADAMLAEREL